MTRWIACIVLATCLSACANGGGRTTVAAASAEQQRLLLDQVKSLAGTWEMTDDKGQKQVASTFTVTSSGSVVREVMFPGSSHEMTNMYHMDGSTLIMTHYCAIGNQPRLRAREAQPGVIDFTFDGITNLHDTQSHYMGAAMRLTMVDANHLTAEWWGYDKGKRVEEATVFNMTRTR